MWISRLVHGIERRWRIVLVAAALVVAASIALAARLRLVTDLAELLPGDDPAVRATQRIQDRLGGVAALQVAIEGPDKDANLQFAQALTDQLAREPRALVDRFAYHVRAERQFFQRAWWLYLEPADLALIRDRLERKLRWAKNPLLIDIDDDRASLDELDARLRHRARQIDRYPDGVFMSKAGDLVVVLVWPPGTLFREHAGEALLARVQSLVRALPAPPGLTVRYAGQIHDAITERAALESDLAWSSGLCVVLIGVAVAAFYGRLRAVPLMAAPALCGVAVALGVAQLAFGQLNTSTAFLGSIILGNGINAAIIQLARYEEERARGASLTAALERSVAHTIRATAAAAFAAATAYGSLVFTRFRGFSQFGAVGAVGMVAAWLATILVLPALIAGLDRRRAVAIRRRGVAFGAPFARLVGRAPRAITALAAALSLAALAVLVPYLHDPFEYDLRRLRSVQHPDDVALAARIEQIFGTLLPTIVVADRPEQTAEIAATLRRRSDQAGGVFGQIVTLDSLLPGTPAEQRDKLAVIAQIRALIHGNTVPLSGAEAAQLARWDPPADLAIVTAESLPPALVQPFRDLRGELVPLVVAYRADRISYWNGHDLLRLASIARTVELSDGARVHGAGNAVVFGAMIEAILRDGPIATILSFAGVALLIVFLARGARGAALVLAALLTGVLWMAGAAAAAGVRINFLNFIALPLTFGIGVDYAINIYLRHRLEGQGQIARTLRATGGAVALCSLTTTIGYASLLLADSQALRSFGALAILGELACLLVAVVVLPAWLILRRRGRDGTRRPETSAVR
ncbi:MAG TPA: MMPL family transporter [Kofleriaceae bacterium]|nr:MMPL family transporter [Kofleriaceae bacterium]